MSRATITPWNVKKDSSFPIHVSYRTASDPLCRQDIRNLGATDDKDTSDGADEGGDVWNDIADED